MLVRNTHFAVLLNANARKVTDRVIGSLTEIIPPDYIYLSRTAEEGDQYARDILDRRFPMVFTGGGDGTVMHFINRMIAHREADPCRVMPDVGILRLGTGNALATMVSSGSYLVDIRSYAHNSHRDRQILALAESESRRFPFGGLGWDAELLNDYVRLKTWAAQGPMAPVVHNVVGYFLALASFTVPRRGKQLVSGTTPQVRIQNLGAPAHRLNHKGERIAEIPSGTTLFEGSANCTIFGTCPYYGYGLKVLPFANMDSSRMQLRVATTGLPTIIANLGSIWKGTYDGEGLVDFLVERIHIEFDREMPYQESGDAMGYRKSVEVGISPSKVSLVRFI